MKCNVGVFCAILLSVLNIRANLSASADVSLKNGNFYTGSKDIVYPGGFELTIERVYNAKTSFRGIFGNGWGNEYEVFLQPTGDGAIIVHEYGGGADNRFDSPTLTASEIAQVADQIAGVAKDQGDITGEKDLAAYHDKLVSDAAFRQGEWQKYVKKGLLQPRVLPVGTRLTSSRFSYQTVVVLRDGYRRDFFDNGRTELYRKDGKLSQITDKNGNYITFSYDVPGQITIRDDTGRSVVLILNDKNLVSRIEGSDGATCTYNYNAWDELIYVKDSAGGEYTYQYDANHRHNLTKMTYPDKTSMQIDYYPREQFENVKSIIDRDGTLTEYAYDIDKSNHLHYTVSVKVSGTIDATGKRDVTSTSQYEYFNQTKPSGEEYTARQINTIDGDRTDTTYNTDGLPLRIEHGGDVISFIYDSKGHVLQKKASDETTDLTYDSVVSKVTSVKITDNSAGKVTADSHFVYDEKGNLLSASTLKKSVKLQYDTKGRIQELDASDGVRIGFEYNVNSKPVKITLLDHVAKGGKTLPAQSIVVTYAASGDIDHVDSSGGRTVAVAVTAAFQDLLDIIRPAGVTLSF